MPWKEGITSCRLGRQAGVVSSVIFCSGNVVSEGGPLPSCARGTRAVREHRTTLLKDGTNKLGTIHSAEPSTVFEAPLPEALLPHRQLLLGAPPTPLPTTILTGIHTVGSSLLTNSPCPTLKQGTTATTSAHPGRSGTRHHCVGLTAHWRCDWPKRAQSGHYSTLLHGAHARAP
jgi:hypothetical protein